MQKKESKIIKVSFLTLSIVICQSSLAEPMMNHVVKGEWDRNKELNVTIESNQRINKKATNIGIASDITYGLSETAGLIGDLSEKNPVVSVTGNVSSFLLKGTSWGLDEWSETLKAAAKAEVHAFVVKDMKTHVADYQNGNVSNPQKRFQEIYLKESAIHKKLLEIDPAFAAFNANLQNEAIAQAVTQGVDTLRSDIRKGNENLTKFIGEKVDLLSKDQREASQTLINGMVRSQKNQNKILSNTEKLAKSQKRMADRLVKGQTKIIIQGEKILLNSRSAAAASNFLVVNEFHKLSPAQKVSELNKQESPWKKRLLAAGLEDSDLQQLQDAAESQKLKQDIVDTTNDIANGVNAFATIAKGLGWKFAQKKEFNDAVKYTNVIASTVTNYLSRNPIGAINALAGGLFGGGASAGPSAGGQQILAKLEEMDVKLDKLLDGQEKILASIEESTKQLMTISNKILQKSDKALEDLDLLIELNSNILDSIEQYSEVPQKLGYCQDFINDMQKLNSSFVEFQKTFAQYTNQYKNCQAVIDKLIPISSIKKDRIHPYFNIAMSSERDATGKVSPQLNKVRNDFRPLLKVLWSIDGLPYDRSKWEIEEKYSVAKLVSALATPSDNFENLRTKSQQFSSDADVVLQAIHKYGFSSDVDGVFLDLLDTKRIENTVNYLIYISPIKPLIDPESILNTPKLLTKDNLFKNKQYENDLRNQYNYALQAVNIAIAQQTLLSGDLLIPHIHDIVFSPSQSEFRDEILNALSRNDVLSKNLMIYSINNSLALKRNLPALEWTDTYCASQLEQSNTETLYQCNLRYYQQAFCLKSNSVNASCETSKPDLQTKWSYVLPEGYRLEGSNIIFSLKDSSTVKIKLPSASELSNAQLIRNKSIDRLLQLRHKLLISADLFNVEKPLDWKTQQIWAFSEEDFEF